MSLVLDSSLALAWLFVDEKTEAAEAVLHSVAEAGAVVPNIWHLEIANTIQLAVRRRRIDGTVRDGFLSYLSALDISPDPETSARAWTSTLGLAERFSLTAYDAAYLELADRRGLPLATLDNELRGAADRLGVALLGR